MPERIAGFEVRHLHGPEEVPYEENELVVLCLVRDGEPWLKSFVEHYRSLGVKHIVFLDNGSRDSTVSVASGYDGVTVLQTELPFDANVEGSRRSGHKVMRRYLIERFGEGRWSLSVDIDELFDYPYSDIIGIDSLLTYLASKSYTAVRAQMLDMFPERPLLEDAGEPDDPLKEVHRFYDISKLERVGKKELLRAAGGGRWRGSTRAFRHERLFKDNNTLECDEIEWFAGGIRRVIFNLLGPLLTKHPLVFSDGTLEPAPPHRVRNARIADFTCVLFHYKFLGHFREQAVQAVREGQYHSKSRAYKKYLEALEKNPKLHLRLETSSEISTTNELLEKGFLVASEDYASWVDAEDEKKFPGMDLYSGPRALAEAFLESRRQERAKTLSVGRLERKLFESRRQEQWKSQRLRRIKQQLADLEARLRDRTPA